MKQWLILLVLTIATVYSQSFQGRTMANGQKYDHSKFTCAHNGYKLGTVLIVSSGANTVEVTVTDRIPKKNQKYKGEWVIDLSGASWKALTDKKPGRLPVKVAVKK